jgi:hypothetical protein
VTAGSPIWRHLAVYFEIIGADLGTRICFVEGLHGICFAQ